VAHPQLFSFYLDEFELYFAGEVGHPPLRLCLLIENRNPHSTYDLQKEKRDEFRNVF